MRSFLLLAVAILPVLSVAQRSGGGRGGGFGQGGGFNHGGGNAPNTFITVASAAPAAATSAAAAPPAGGNNGGGNGGGGGAATGGSGAVSAALIPPYGITPGVKANDGTANCVGDSGKAIPCTCPPPVDDLVTAVEAQVAGGASFPTGSSAADQLARLNTCIVALQNVNGGPGSGVGCPLVSTTWGALRTQLQSDA